VCALSLVGCGQGPGSSSAAATVQSFFDALAAEDAEAACAWLAPETVSTLEDAAEQPCTEALPDEGVEPAPLDRVSVYGQSAFVETQADTAVFLGRFPDGWRVTAAGCEPRSDLPYDCAVESG
jgi:hypothetical protein